MVYGVVGELGQARGAVLEADGCGSTLTDGQLSLGRSATPPTDRLLETLSEVLGHEAVYQWVHTAACNINIPVQYSRGYEGFLNRNLFQISYL